MSSEKNGRRRKSQFSQ